MNTDYSKKIATIIEASIVDCAIKDILEDALPLMVSGKMLRAHLTMTIGAATQLPEAHLLAAAATVELIHLASLLHDDVIDNGTLRRGAPTFWVKKGTPGAILMGDYLVCRAFSLLLEATSEKITAQLLRCTQAICEAELKQELDPPASNPAWDDCLQIARKKTGSLFAFAAYAATDERPGLAEALLETGYEMGTAYQLADDLLDATGDPSKADKTLGNDARQGKNTAISAGQNVDMPQVIHTLIESSLARLSPWPKVYRGYEQYLIAFFQPVVNSFAENLRING